MSGISNTHRPREYKILSFSDSDVEQSILSMGVTGWVSSMVQGAIMNSRFDHSDFMGSDQSVVSVDDLVWSMLFYAFKMGRRSDETQWIGGSYSDFERREKVFEKMLIKVHNFSTQAGERKIAKTKREIRIGVESYEIINKTPIDRIGVFVDLPEMEAIVSETSPDKFIHQLQELGRYEENDPRYYIHTIFRYHINELHQILSEKNKVMRFPTLQRFLDITQDVSSFTNLPPEFRTFMQRVGVSSPQDVSLPLPSKTKLNSVVYGYDFETHLWVRVMRQEISNVISGWKSSTSTTYSDVYPRQLILGDPGNKRVTAAFAKYTEMRHLKEVYDSLREIDTSMFLRIIDLLPDAVDIFPTYKKSVFYSPGEQLAERRGFFIHSTVRSIFNRASKAFKGNDFCNDVYKTLSIRRETIDEWYEYCSVRRPRKFTQEDHDTWRIFLFALEKICLVFHVCSRIPEIEEFYLEYGTEDQYVSRVLGGGEMS